MKNGMMSGVAREIRHSLVQDTVPRRRLSSSAKAGMADMLLKQLAGELLRQLEDEGGEDESSDLDARVTSLETLVQQLVATDMEPEDDKEDEDEDEVEGGERRLPNLKYAKPKYKDVESVLKYIEDGEGGALKLVIMNFND